MSDETPTFEVGDVVMVKGQAVKMTVDRVYDTYVGCVWFDRATLLRSDFKYAILQKVQA